MDLRISPRDRIARHTAAQRKLGLRPVVIWLPDVNEPGYRQRLAAECRKLAQPTADETTIAEGFASLAAQTDGWQ
jgi:hypothetical protein